MRQEDGRKGGEGRHLPPLRARARPRGRHRSGHAQGVREGVGGEGVRPRSDGRHRLPRRQPRAPEEGPAGNTPRAHLHQRAQHADGQEMAFRERRPRPPGERRAGARREVQPGAVAENEDVRRQGRSLEDDAHLQDEGGVRDARQGVRALQGVHQEGRRQGVQDGQQLGPVQGGPRRQGRERDHNQERDADVLPTPTGARPRSRSSA